MASAGIFPRSRIGSAFALIGTLGALFGTPAPVRSAEARRAAVLPEDPLAGKRIFVEKGCGRCHAIHGQGGSLGPDLGKVGVWRSVMELAGVLWNHLPEMMAKMHEHDIRRPTISTEEMVDLAAFLYFLNYFDQPGDPSEGEWLFAEKGCVQCHSVGGQGGEVGPPLDAYKRYTSPLSLGRAMWSHSVAMARAMIEHDIARPTLADRDLAHIFAYIQSISRESSGDRIATAPGSPARGERIFEQKECVRCHATRSAGGNAGPDLGEAELHRSVTEIAALMWNYEPAMWAKMQVLGMPLPQFRDDELADLMAYLFFLQYFDPPGDAATGEQVYADKGCILCHSAPASPGQPHAPDLFHSPALASPLALASAMWNHAPAMEARIRERGLPWPHFKGGEMRDLVQFLRAGHAPDGSRPGATPQGRASEDAR